MFITLDPTFNELGEAELRLNRDVIESLLIQHIQGNHLFVLSPRQLTIIRGALSFQGLPARSLEVISRKSQAYHASMRDAHRVVSVRPISSGGEAHICGREISVSPRWLSTRLGTPPSLFLENAVNDGGLYKALIGKSAPEIGADASLMVFRPVHGGGGTIAAVMEEVHGPQLKGLCVCDKDLSAPVSPPFRANSTAEAAYQSLQRMGVLDPQCEPTIDNPLFSFRVTSGWAVENYIGPNQLDAYFTAEHSVRALRRSFSDTFLRFPDLTPNEMALWLSINFRDHQNLQQLKSGYEQRVGGLVSNNAQISRAAELIFPSGSVQWIAKNTSGTRWSNVLDGAFKKDCTIFAYKEAIQNLSKMAHYLLAGDSSVHFT